MSDLKLNSEYGVVLNRCMKAFDPELMPGLTTLFVWRDQEHFDTSSRGVIDGRDSDIRLVNLPTQPLVAAGLHMPPECAVNKVAVFAAAFGQQQDLSDLVCKYYLIFLLDRSITQVTMPDDSTLRVSFAVVAPK